MPFRTRSWAAAPTPRRIAYIVGVVLVAGGLAVVPAIATAAIYREWETALHLGLTLALAVGIGFVTIGLSGRPERLRPKDAFAGVAIAWVSVIVFGSLPYLLSGSFGVTDALFESTAGFTTTGATVIEDLSQTARGLVLWRATTQWLGGMGIIVLSMAVLPLVGAGGIQLARAETPGPEPDRLTPRFRGTAVRLWALYVTLTVAAAVLLALGEMTVFEAIAHALTSVSTGGFSTESGSLGAFSPYSQWVILVLMVAAGTSFTLHIRGLRDPTEYLRKREFRYYLISLAIGIALVMGGVALDGIGVPVRESMFTAIATITGTGYAVTDYAIWPAAVGGVILMMMFIGGMGGSTTGALKTYRAAIVLKSAAAEVRRLTRPRAVSISRFGRAPLPPEVVSAVHSYVVVYMLAFGIGAVMLLYFESAWGADMDIVTGLSAAASAISNVGPGLGTVGPASTYADVAAPGKWILGMLMILGRLEIYPVILLFTASFWRR